jgi:hypothetical protein
MKLEAIRDLIQVDIGNRGLRSDPDQNLVNAWPDDFQAACRSLAETRNAVLGIVTGFFIPHANPPTAENDGPLGAVFLARTLPLLGIPVAVFADAWCLRGIEAGLQTAGMAGGVSVQLLPPASGDWDRFLPAAFCPEWPDGVGRNLTHLLAIERVGPSHTPLSVQPDERLVFQSEVPVEHHDRCHTMAGRDNTAETAPAHLLFEACTRRQPRITTIGIGDGGNEIGMGKIPWEIIRRNIPSGGLVACRVPADYLIVCGISNWGAYALAAGMALLRGAKPPSFDVEQERAILQAMILQGPLVDGLSGLPALSVDGIAFNQYAEPLRRLATMFGGGKHA